MKPWEKYAEKSGPWSKYQADPQAQPESNVGLGIARSAVEGLTLGWSDELGTSLAALAVKVSGADEPISDIYSDMMASYKAEQGQFEEEHPYLATGAKVAGGLATGIAGAGKLLPSATAGVGKRLATYGATGAGYGAVTGAGEAEQGGRIRGAAIGGAAGGVLGAAIPAIGMGVTATARKFAERLPSQARTIAGRQVAKDISEAGMDAGTAASRLREMGPKATLADISVPTRARAEHVAQLPGAGAAASKTFIERNVGAGQRVADTIEGLNKGKVDLAQYVDDIIVRTKEQADPAYRKAFDLFDVKTNPITRPAQAITGRGQTSKILYNLSKNKLVKKAAESRGVTLSPNKPMGLEEWNSVKKGLDDIGYGKTTTNVMGRVEGDVQAARKMSGAVVRELDSLVKKGGGGTSYADARKIYSGSAKAIEASEEGAKFWNKTPQQIERALREMPKSERDSFKLAGLQKLYDEALKTTEGGSAYAKLFNNAANKAKIKALLQDDDSFNALESILRREKEFNITYKDVTQGSQTARKMAGIDEAGIDPGPAVTAASGFPGTAAIQWASGKLRQLSLPESQRKELADILMTPGPQALAKLKEVMTQLPPKSADRRILSQIIASQSGMAAGR